MRFFNFLHRRSKSDPTLGSKVPTVGNEKQPKPRSHSLGRFSFPSLGPSDIFKTAVPANVPSTFFHPVPLDPKTDSPHPAVLAANFRIMELEAENNNLRASARTWSADFATLKAELKNARGDLYAELHKDVHHRRQMKIDEEEIERLDEKLLQYERFLGLMINLGLHHGVLGKAHVALRAGQDADEALVDAIKEAAAVPGSAWSGLIPAVVGLRTQDEYLSALSITLQTRKELRECKKIAKFWKRTAKEDSKNTDTVTPSTSNISSIHEALSPERQSAVDALLAYRHESWKQTEDEFFPTAPPVVPTINYPSGHVDHVLDPIIEETLSESNLAALASSTSLSSFSLSYLQNTSIQSLPPLASESFKQELVTQASSERLFKRTSPIKDTKSRIALAPVDTNIATVKSSDSLSRQSPASKKASGNSSLGKKKASVPSPQKAEPVEVIVARNTSPNRRKVGPSQTITATPSTPTKTPTKTDKPIRKPSPTPNPGLSSSCTPSEADLKLNLRLLHALDRSVDETPAASSSNAKVKDSNEDWSVMEDQELDLDLSFVAAADADATPTPPATPPPAPTETDTPKAKSRLPMIKKHLRRLSFQKTPTELKPVTPLVVNKKNPRPSVPASPSPTRLPTPAAKGALRATFASSGKKVAKRMSKSAT